MLIILYFLLVAVVVEVSFLTLLWHTCRVDMIMGVIVLLRLHPFYNLLFHRIHVVHHCDNLLVLRIEGVQTTVPWLPRCR